MAGSRGEPPGAVAVALVEAARVMNYHVRSIHDFTSIGPGRHAWTQILFMRLRSDEQSLPMSAMIPFGEADLVLGLDPRETIRAIAPDMLLRVASAGETCAVVNCGPFIDDHDFENPALDAETVASSIAAVSAHNRCVTADFAAACRAWFHSDRVSDMTMLGVAYQRGFIPASPEAIESGLAVAEARGFGRSRLAFEFGRRLAVKDSLLTHHEDDSTMPTGRIARRLALGMRSGFVGSASRARRFATLVQTSLEQMPGLSETDVGRQAARDFVMACHHCSVWGGLEYAETFADVITRLYQVDRGDTGRLLTRNTILPLAECMLIRDPLYVAGLAASAEHRRRIRERMHAKRSRGDEIERRYLTRIDLLAFSRRIRIDLRTSDWPARIVSAIRRVTPGRFRGMRRERQLRDYMLEVARRAIAESPTNYDAWCAAMQRLNDQASDDRLRGMALAEVRMLTGLQTERDQAPGQTVS
jgi:indolepyruvate ferredoxin oxidoreductase